MKLLLSMLLLACSINASAQINEINLSSPVATYKTFYNAMEDYSKGINNDLPKLEKRISDALQTFEPHPDSESAYSKSNQRDQAVYLKEILDRILTLPSAPNISNNQITGTNIFFVQKDNWFYISKRSLDRAEIDFENIKKLPYQKGIENPGASHKSSWAEQFLPEDDYSIIMGLTKTQWILIALYLVLALVIYYGFSFLVIVIESLLFSKHSMTFEIINALSKPIATLIATLFLKVMGAKLGLTGNASYIWASFTQILLSISFFWVLYGLIDPADRALKRLTAKTTSDLDDQLVPLVSKTAKVMVFFLAILSIVQSLGVNVFSLLAGVGVGGLAIALAAKDTAANLFGSLMILFDQPFKIGDWIKLSNMEGTVEEIGFRSTRIRTFYDSQIVIPNATVASAEIDNLGRRQYRRTVETLGLTYSTTKEDLEAFISGIKEILKAHSTTKDEKSYVSFKRFGDSALEVLLYFFLDVKNYDEELRGKEEIFLEIKILAEKIGVEFAYPSQSLYIEKGSDLC